MYRLSILSLLLFFIACTKEGKTGPQGPEGNANVKSVNFGVQAGDWQYQPGSAYLEHMMPEITKAIYDSGTINLYWHVNNSWVALPVTFPLDTITRTMGYNYDEGKLRIVVTNSDGTTPLSLNTANYRAVVISGN